MKNIKAKTRNYLFQGKGQSLVEVALFLPLALMLIAGVVEISQWLLVQNRINPAARAAARFGANGGKDEGMAAVALGTVTQTLPINADSWDIWTVRGTVNADGSDIVDKTFTYSHVYGNGSTQRYGEFSGSNFESQLRKQILEALQSDIDGNGNVVTNTSSVRTAIGGLQFVGSYVQYDARSILGLDYFVDDLYTVRDLAVMRTFPSGDQTAGCSAFPVAVNLGIRSVTSSYWPAPNEFTYPTSNQPRMADFPKHVPDQPLENAKPGYVYFIQQGGGPGNFGWLKWNDDLADSANTLEDGFTMPGSSVDYITPPQNARNSQNSSWRQAGFSGPVKGYMEPGDPMDQSLNKKDWVAGLTGAVNSNGVRSQLNNHVDNKRYLRLIIWDESQGTGSNAKYKVKGFAIFRLLGYRLNQGNGNADGSWILAEFVKMDDSCGETQSTNPVLP